MRIHLATSDNHNGPGTTRLEKAVFMVEDCSVKNILYEYKVDHFPLYLWDGIIKGKIDRKVLGFKKKKTEEDEGKIKRDQKAAHLVRDHAYVLDYCCGICGEKLFRDTKGNIICQVAHHLGWKTIKKYEIFAFDDVGFLVPAHADCNRIYDEDQGTFDSKSSTVLIDAQKIRKEIEKKGLIEIDSSHEGLVRTVQAFAENRNLRK